MSDEAPPPLSRVILLPMVDLHIDVTYHDPVNEAAYTSICRAFHPKALGLLLVHQRPDGTYWVVDGATRVRALRTLGVAQVAAEVVEGWTIAQERTAYALRNTTVPKYSMALYKARLFSAGLLTPPASCPVPCAPSPPSTAGGRPA